MVAWQIWIVVGLVLFILELFTPGFYIMSVGLGCFVSALGSALHLSFILQVVLLAAGSLASIFLLRPLLLRYKGDGKKSGVDALVGREALVIESIDNASNEGRIKVGGENWKARSVEDQHIEKGTIVIIEHISGVTASVKTKESEKS
ncbi:membrane protein implicated in regulation of membrane protease activity [Sphaerochaeta pleomorpha str. Grapes]|uniref:Membrane protein implicated in regulation of membrane protease activity n=1 Tax=Sphaerochaeta pleomorpha (strain ATCC BAA-1885 / DSM 22778 / Grapes) TaxID=158190 RepID=G8QTK4_SPHPG|nr:NfeD family protein [Sphaerochaeta pleomorpha]AEV27969.1 membrane protein implicated in regulation of membrane protease activity [Sphaerochaeta pleomorpha str. Grapes]